MDDYNFIEKLNKVLVGRTVHSIDTFNGLLVIHFKEPRDKWSWRMALVIPEDRDNLKDDNLRIRLHWSGRDDGKQPQH